MSNRLFNNDYDEDDDENGIKKKGIHNNKKISRKSSKKSSKKTSKKTSKKPGKKSSKKTSKKSCGMNGGNHIIVENKSKTVKKTSKKTSKKPSKKTSKKIARTISDGFAKYREYVKFIAGKLKKPNGGVILNVFAKIYKDEASKNNKNKETLLDEAKKLFLKDLDSGAAETKFNKIASERSDKPKKSKKDKKSKKSKKDATESENN